MYEYKLVRGGSLEDLIRMLNQEAKNGWELWETLNDNGIYKAILYREVGRSDSD